MRETAEGAPVIIGRLQRFATDAVMAAGAPYGIRPGGPNHVERVESGLLSWGGDTTPDSNPFEAGMARFVDVDLDPDRAAERGGGQIGPEPDVVSAGAGRRREAVRVELVEAGCHRAEGNGGIVPNRAGRSPSHHPCAL